MNELDEWLKKMPDVSMTTVITSNITKKERIKILAKSIVDTDCTCYIAGPEAMVENTEHILLDLGVRVDAIKIDSFSGY